MLKWSYQNIRQQRVYVHEKKERNNLLTTRLNIGDIVYNKSNEKEINKLSMIRLNIGDIVHNKNNEIC